MPKDPFGGLGSRGSEQAVKASARAVRAYSTDLKRLLGIEQAVGKAAADRAIAASRAVGQQNTALDKTTALLKAQGKSLTHLDRTRQKYHDAEITRTKALAYHYEKAKQFLTELREDSRDTSSVLGMFTRGMEEGAQNMLRFGALPTMSTQIREVNAEADDVVGTAARMWGALTDIGANAQETGLNTYRENMVALDSELALVSKRFNMADGAAKKLSNTIIQMAAVDMGGGDGAIAMVADLSAQLAELNLTAGVTADQGMSFAIERAQQVGGSLATAVEELEHFSAMADITRKAVDESNYGLTRFSASIREDFVRAMADARRSIKGQAVDLENVGAAYQWASQQALKYGLSATGAAEFSGAIGKMTTGQAGKLTAETVFAGESIQDTIREAIEKYKESSGIDRTTSYEEMTPEQQRAAQAAVGRGLGDQGQGNDGSFTREQLTSYRQSIESRGGSALSSSQAYERHASSQQGIRAMLEAQRNLLGGVDEDTLSHMLRERYGLDVTQETATTLAENLKSGDIDEAMEQMRSIKATADMATAGPSQTDAISAVVAMKDPINELFNIKNYLKTIALNVDNIVGLVVDATGAVGAQYDSASRWTRDLITGGNTGETEGALETRDTLQSQGRDLAAQLAAAQEEQGSAGSDAARERAAATVEALGTQIQENTVAQSENAAHIGALAEEAGVIGRRSGPAPGSSPGAPTSEGEAASRAAGGDFLSSVVSALPPEAAAAVAVGARLLGLGGSSSGGSAGKAGVPASAGIAPPGTASGVGEGSITVGADGSKNLTMSVRLDGFDEAIAHENSQQNITRR